ncbi:hypothetical protein VTI74DRAFT_3563 [Chaetomium olivicolor]
MILHSGIVITGQALARCIRHAQEIRVDHMVSLHSPSRGFGLTCSLNAGLKLLEVGLPLALWVITPVSAESPAGLTALSGLRATWLADCASGNLGASPANAEICPADLLQARSRPAGGPRAGSDSSYLRRLVAPFLFDAAVSCLEHN